MTFVDIVFSLAAFVVMTSYIFKDVLVLRLLAVLGGSGYLLGSLFMPIGTPGKLSLLIFSGLNVSINLIHSFILIIKRYTQST